MTETDTDKTEGATDAAAPADRPRDRERGDRESRRRGATDKTIPGGRYQVNGVWVNAEGQPLE